MEADPPKKENQSNENDGCLPIVLFYLGNIIVLSSISYLANDGKIAIGIWFALLVLFMVYKAGGSIKGSIDIFASLAKAVGIIIIITIVYAVIVPSSCSTPRDFNTGDTYYRR